MNMNEQQTRNFIRDCSCYDVCLKRINSDFMSVQFRKRMLNEDRRKYKFITYMNAALPYLRKPRVTYKHIKSTKTVQLLYRNTECFAPIKFTMGLTKVETDCIHEIHVMQGVVQIHINPERHKPIPIKFRRKIREKDVENFISTTLSSRKKSASSITLPTGCDYFIFCPRAALFTYRVLTSTIPPTVRPMFPLQDDNDGDEDSDFVEITAEESSYPALPLPGESRRCVTSVNMSNPEYLSLAVHNDIKKEEEDDSYDMSSSSISLRDQNERNVQHTGICQTHEDRSQNSRTTAEGFGNVADALKQEANESPRCVTPIDAVRPEDLSASGHKDIKQEEDDSYDMNLSSMSLRGQNERSAPYTGICQTYGDRSQNSRTTAEALDNAADGLKQVAYESLRYVTPIDTSGPEDLSTSVHNNIKQEEQDDISSRGQNERTSSYMSICQTDEHRSQNLKTTAAALENMADAFKRVAHESLRYVAPVDTSGAEDLSAFAHNNIKQEDEEDDSCGLLLSSTSSSGHNEKSSPYMDICQTDEGRSQNLKTTAEALGKVADALKQVANESLRCVTPVDTSGPEDLSAFAHNDIKQEQEDDSYGLLLSSTSSRGHNERSSPYMDICQTDEGRLQNSRMTAEALDNVADAFKQESPRCVTPVDTSGPEDLSSFAHNDIKQDEDDDSCIMLLSSTSSRNQNQRSSPYMDICQTDEGRLRNARITAEALDNVAAALRQVANESLRCVIPVDTSGPTDLSASVHNDIKQEQEDDSYGLLLSSTSSRNHNEKSAPYTDSYQTDEGRLQNSRTAEALDNDVDAFKQELPRCVAPVDASGPEDLSAYAHNDIKQEEEDDSFDMNSSSTSSRGQNERSAPHTGICRTDEDRLQNSRTTAEALDNVADALKQVANAIQSIPHWLLKQR